MSEARGKLTASPFGDLHISRFLTLQFPHGSAVVACLIAVFADLENGQESLLRDIDAADPFHSFFAFLLFFEELAFAGNVAAVAFGNDVFPYSRYGFAGYDFRADRGLDCHFEHLPGDKLPHL